MFFNVADKKTPSFKKFCQSLLCFKENFSSIRPTNDVISVSYNANVKKYKKKTNSKQASTHATHTHTHTHTHTNKHIVNHLLLQ